MAVFEVVDGLVEIQEAGSSVWNPVAQYDNACAQSIIRVGSYGRAALRLPDNSLLKISANSHLTLGAPQQGRASLITILRGIIHVISRDPRSLRFDTPYANAGLEGTEFDIAVDGQQTTVTVIEGEVLLSNASGQLYLPSGRQGSARATSAPESRPAGNRFEQADWTPYFEPILPGALPEPGAPPDGYQAGDPTFFSRRAASRLSVGAVTAAGADLSAALRIDPRNAEAHALQAMIALVQGDKGRAERYAGQAVEFDANAAAPLLALSHVQQSQLLLADARRSLARAVELEPDNAIAWARLAEIRLASGDSVGATDSVRRALHIDSELAHAHTVLGFAMLNQTDAKAAETIFRRAVALTQASPLPRLGLGLALIRQGRFEEGRLETEVAVIQNPQSSILRSYMARVYAAQNRGELSGTQLELARLLDPTNPTAFVYEALNKQSVNEPVQALQAYQTAIALNNDRARYRSTLLLDDDLAARSSGFGQLHRQLGFEQLALLEGWKSTAASPEDYSGHRMLFDVYAALPNHEIARANELLLSQMLQPINLTPLQPQLAEANLFLLDRRGPSDLAFKEYGPLLSQNGRSVQLSAIGASRDTTGVDLTVAGLQDKLSYSLGYFGFDTAGFRQNNDLDQQLANAFIQYRRSDRTSLQAELRASRIDSGDLALFYDRSAFSPNQRHEEQVNSLRLGVRHDLSPDSVLLGSLVREDIDLSVTSGPSASIDARGSGTTLEIRHLYEQGKWHLNSGLRHFDRDQTELSSASFPIPIEPFMAEIESFSRFTVRHTSIYAYWDYMLSRRLSTTFGLSADRMRGQFLGNDQVNPKFGLTWEPSARTTVRLSAFRTLQGPIVSRRNIQPRLEPTHVNGFNQFFFGSEGDDAWRAGIALDREINEHLFAGLEVSTRDLSRQALALMPDLSVALQHVPVDEDFYRAYLYWAPRPAWSFSAEYRLEEVDGRNNPLPQGYTRISTRRLPVQMSFFHNHGLSTRIGMTYVDQNGNFSPMTFGLPDTARPGEDNFIVYDLSLNYRFPQRRGSMSLNIDNVFDESFRFQDHDPENSSIVPERMMSLRFSLSY
jgi:Tfp pilus assembly protein PilF